MGQSSSRNRAARRDTEAASSVATPRPQSQQHRQRTTSVRRSILNIVKPSNSTPHTSPSSDSRPKSWRRSRRWSKAVSPSTQETPSSQPQRVLPQHDTVDNISSQMEGVENSSSRTLTSAASSPMITTPFTSSDDTYPVVESVTTDKVVGPVPDTLQPNAGPSVTDINAQATNILERRDELEVENSAGLGNGSSSLAERLGISKENLQEDEKHLDTDAISPSLSIQPAEDSQQNVPDEMPPSAEAPILPTLDASEPEVTPPPSSLPTAQPQQQQQQARFPPPGTLVLVQGVVQTTDVARPTPPAPNNETPVSDAPSVHSPRPRSSSTPGSSTSLSSTSGGSGNARNRLSALIGSRSRASSSLGQNNADTSSSSLSDTSTISATANPAPTETSTPTPPSSTTPASNAISSSSIEVLGTLLSVAAAATAASLLTGSTEHILTPTSSATSPPSTRGSAADLADYSMNARRERMRHAWSSVRERLGLRTPDAPLTPESPVASGDGTNLPTIADQVPRRRDNAQPTDAREMMLAEMARAFNMGLGLGETPGEPNGESGTSSSNEAESTTPPGPDSEASSEDRGERPAATPPAEGSFERFLLDLQADLRVTLTQNQGEADTAETERTRSDGPSTGEETPRAQTEGTSITETPTPQPDITPVSVHEVGGESPSAVPSDDLSDVPSLDYVSALDVESEGEDAEVSEDEDIDLTDFEESSRPTSSQTFGSGPGLNDEHVDEQTNPQNETERNINWWRMYRFPPIHVSATRGSGPLATVPPIPSSTTTTAMTAEAAPVPMGVAAEPSIDAASPAAPGTPADMVYPIIVVGLRSVNLPNNTNGARTSDPPAAPEDIPAFAENPLTPPQTTDADPLSSESEQPRRAWRTRASDAFRNLRPGRRAVESERQANENAGSRTFLIFVIGGYYPPDHTMVTGGENRLGSFEALLELAELIGQVKPPTASREDIEKSGLQTIKASELVRYEQEGKISSNCTERCLICLDEYEAENDVRLLNCRHGFHKDCVDRWLETGRNNCPACRSTGVNVESSSPLG